MLRKALHILFIEDNPGDVRLIKEMLLREQPAKYIITSANSLDQGLKRLKDQDIDLVLLDLGLPDSQGLDTLRAAIDAETNLPVVVLTGLEGKSVGAKAIQIGAQDYLVKGKIEGRLLTRSIRYAIERHELEEKLKKQAMRDQLTGLYNRWYFNRTLEREVKRCQRYDHSMAFLIIDINEFKKVNDRYSHLAGDKVLKQLANILEENLRDVDITVRYGGDEFLIVMPETGGDLGAVISRLKKKLKAWNDKNEIIDFPLSVAVGSSYWNPQQDRDVEDALNEADRKMYEDKPS